MKSFEIEGQAKLKGEVTISGNKNAVLPAIAASILTDQEVVLHNVPCILDVENMLRIGEHIGMEINRSGSTIRLRTTRIPDPAVPKELSSMLRTSILFAGPLLARCGKSEFWHPGGDFIGRRRLDAHIYGLKGLGAKLASSDQPYKLEAKKLRGRDLFLDEASVTATEHLLMTATLAHGTTTIRNAASEPHVQDLAELLVRMGAKISGIRTDTLVVEGVEKLGGAEHTIPGDHIEAASFLSLAAATGSEMTISGTVPSHYWMTRRIFERFNVKFTINPGSIFIPGHQKLRIQNDFGNAIPVISDGPWPQFPTDMMSCAIVMATQATGTVLFFEKMFEGRMYFIDRLIGMGANAIVCDPHRAVISGPSELRGIEMSSPDIRAGMAMLIAALCAKGKSIINNAHVISRGYEDINLKIEKLGGRIRTI